MTDSDIKREIAAVLNRACMENGSDTPDSILAEYLWACLRAFDTATKARDAWWGMKPWAKATPSLAAPTSPPGGEATLPVDDAAEARIEKLLAEQRADAKPAVCATCKGEELVPTMDGPKGCPDCGGTGLEKRCPAFPDGQHRLWHDDGPQDLCKCGKVMS